MEEDDLLDEEVRHEQDLWQKLQRGFDGEGNSHAYRGGYNYDRGGFGERDFGRGDQGLRGVDLGPQVGRGFGRGQLGRRDLERGNRASGDAYGRSQPTTRGGQEQRGPRAQGVGSQRKISEIETIF